MKWRPIETAPKDGTEFMGYKPNGVGGEFIAACRWGVVRGAVRWDWPYTPDPTHWQPLPKLIR